MKNSKVLKSAVVAAAMLPMAQAFAEVNISGWLNEEMMFFDNGNSSDVAIVSGNGATLGSRLTFSGSSEIPNTGMTAGFEIIMEPQGFGSAAQAQPLLNNQTALQNANEFQTNITLLSRNVSLAGSFGKVTMGLLSTPTDNIGVLSDPTLGLWDAIAIPYHGAGINLRTGGATTAFSTASFLSCGNLGGLGIGADCNGIYRNGIRYDLPAFGGLQVAVGYANDDIYDISAEWKGNLGRLTTNVGMGYTINQGGAGGWDEAEVFQMQAGVHDAGATGLYIWGYYQNEEADVAGGGAGQDDSDVYVVKGGIKKQWLSVGETAISGFYGSYNDQFGFTGFTDSEVERFGFSVVQHFGGGLQLYGAYENLDTEASVGGVTTNFDEVDVFTLGTVVFF